MVIYRTNFNQLNKNANVIKFMHSYTISEKKTQKYENDT